MNIKEAMLNLESELDTIRLLVFCIYSGSHSPEEIAKAPINSQLGNYRDALIAIDRAISLVSTRPVAASVLDNAFAVVEEVADLRILRREDRKDNPR